jgi:hypothetical protein
MDISGKFMQQLPVQTGEGKNGTWQKGGFIIETSNEKFPKKVCFTTWGDIIGQTQGFQPGEMVKVYFDLESREYSGRWYSDIKAWKVENASNAAPSNNMPSNTGRSSEPASPNTSTPASNGGSFTVSEDDDLPF